MEPDELRRRGFDVLVKELGWVNAVRFFQLVEPGKGDYTKERDSLLSDWDAEETMRQVKEFERKFKEGSEGRA